MTHETFDKIIERTEEFAVERDIKELTIVFHGGEPLLAPDSFYEHAYHSFNSSKILSKIPTKFTIQTNLTLFMEKKLPHLMKLLGDVPLVGTSYDPISKSRKLNYNKSYEEEFMKSYFHLRSLGSSVNIIYPVTKSAFGREREIYKFYKNLGVVSLTVKPALDYDRDMNPDEQFSAMEYAGFLVRLYEEWVNDNYGICIEPFNGWTVKHKTGNPEQLTCYFSGECSRSMFLVLPNGDTYECCEFTRIHDRPVGNVYKNGFEVVQSNREQKIDERFEIMRDNTCKGCKWWSYCHGYCPIHTHDEREYDLHYFCESYMHFFNTVFQEPFSGEVIEDLSGIKQHVKNIQITV
jgi:uncharacterized protein